MSFAGIIDKILWFVKRWFVRQDDPQLKYQKAKIENAQIIQSGNADAINAKLDTDLDRL